MDNNQNGPTDPLSINNNPATQIALTSILKTNNPIIDILIALTLPLFVRVCYNIAMKLQPPINELITFFIGNNKPICERTIDYEFTYSRWGEKIRTEEESRNEILQKAITMYINRNGNLKIKHSRVNLMSIMENDPSTNSTNNYCYGNMDSDNNENSISEQLKQYKIQTTPLLNDWIILEDGIEFLQNIRSHGDSDESNEDKKNNSGSSSSTGNKNINIQYRLKGDSLENINNFLQRAYNWYIDAIRKTEDTNLYYYVLMNDNSSSDSDDGGGGGRYGRSYKQKLGPKCKRYVLSGEKTFKSLFFPEKDNLLKILNNFQQKIGKYAIDGYPYKLGLMLFGPPGTGKTSLIKAIAEKTQRNIISIPLAKIKTNQELMDLVYDGCYNVPGQDFPTKLKFENIIFVIEDIDCATKVVLRRKPAIVKTTVIMEKQSNLITNNNNNNNKGSSNSASINNSNEEKEEINDDNTIKITPLPAINTGSRNQSYNGDGLPEEEQKPSAIEEVANLLFGATNTSSTSSSTNKKDNAISFKSQSDVDKLDLSGILNVLDGIVDCPGRILIMTSNHPDKLDPALTRPGRIDKMIHLDYIKAGAALCMMKHYYQLHSIPEKIKNRIEIFFGRNDVQLTPAQVEAFCAEFDYLEDLINKLETNIETNIMDIVF